MAEPLEKLVTGNPIVGARRTWGEVAPAKRFGVGVLGLHEGNTMLVALHASGLCYPVAGCDLREEKRLEAEASTPGLFTTAHYEEMLARPEVDIIAIYTPDSSHADHIEAAFRAGKHVICTKPIINDPVDANRLRIASDETGCRLQVGQSTRFGEPFLRQRECFEQGEIGDVEVVDAHYNHNMAWYYRKSPWTIAETHWAYLGLSHPVDLVSWYLGPIREVHAFGTTTSVGSEFGIPSPDAITVNLIGFNGRIGRVLGNYGYHELPRARSLIECHLMGSKGTSLARYPELRFTHHDERGIEIDEDFTHAMTGYYYRHELTGMHYGEFCNYADYFAAKLLSGEPNSPNLEEGLATVMVMRAIVQSLQTGRAVAVGRV